MAVNERRTTHSTPQPQQQQIQPHTFGANSQRHVTTVEGESVGAAGCCLGSKVTVPRWRDTGKQPLATRSGKKEPANEHTQPAKQQQQRQASQTEERGLVEDLTRRRTARVETTGQRGEC